jgi:ribonucleoside-triphosphate reductase
MTGSIGVVTLNLPRVGYLSKTKEEFMARVERLMDLAKESLEIKRKVVAKNIEQGLLPFTKRYLPSLHNHFSTIGLNGMNEAIRNFMPDHDIATPQGKAFAEEVLEFMRRKLADYQEETGSFYNMEATPAEGATYRLAKEDKKRYPDIIQAGGVGLPAGQAGDPYYTNSSHLPVGYTDNALEALEHQDSLQTKYTGGTVLHLFLGERVQSWEATRDFVKKVAYSFKLPYFTVTPTFSICPSHGYINGEEYQCGTCGEQTEVWSRVMGYFRPVDQWNKGKKSEYRERKEYVVNGEAVAVGELSREASGAEA